jgi:hypothetical protein
VPGERDRDEYHRAHNQRGGGRLGRWWITDPYQKIPDAPRRATRRCSRIAWPCRAASARHRAAVSQGHTTRCAATTAQPTRQAQQAARSHSPRQNRMAWKVGLWTQDVPYLRPFTCLVRSGTAPTSGRVSSHGHQSRSRDNRTRRQHRNPDRASRWTERHHVPFLRGLRILLRRRTSTRLGSPTQRTAPRSRTTTPPRAETARRTPRDLHDARHRRPTHSTTHPQRVASRRRKRPDWAHHPARSTRSTQCRNQLETRHRSNHLRLVEAARGGNRRSRWA